MVVVGHVVSLACLSSIGVSRSATVLLSAAAAAIFRPTRSLRYPGEDEKPEEKVLSLSTQQCTQIGKTF